MPILKFYDRATNITEPRETPNKFSTTAPPRGSSVVSPPMPIDKRIFICFVHLKKSTPFFVFPDRFIFSTVHFNFRTYISPSGRILGGPRIRLLLKEFPISRTDLIGECLSLLGKKKQLQRGGHWSARTQVQIGRSNQHNKHNPGRFRAWRIYTLFSNIRFCVWELRSRHPVMCYPPCANIFPFNFISPRPSVYIIRRRLYPFLIIGLCRSAIHSHVSGLKSL